MKLDKTIIRETKYIAVCVSVFSIIMEAVFIILSKWSMRVLFGNILGATTAILNFLVMGVTLQRAISKNDENAKKLIKTSWLFRTFVLFMVVITGVSVKGISAISTIIPLFFPRFAIFLRPLWKDRDNSLVEVRQNGG